MSEENSLVLEAKLIDTEMWHDEILERVKSQMGKRGRKPKSGVVVENNVWDDVQYRRDYFNDYYKNVLKNKPIEMVECECGRAYNKLHKSQHNHSKHHILYMDIKGKILVEKNPVEKNV